MGYVFSDHGIGTGYYMDIQKYFPYFTAQKDLFPVGDKVLKRKE